MTLDGFDILDPTVIAAMAIAVLLILAGASVWHAVRRGR